ncbi:integral membrane protein [Colletotrichum caudatum]|nr:integral membrane protein [Colletotrichum caudatum]
MDPESQTLAPLPDVLHRGLTAVSLFAFLSFVSTTILLFVLTYRLVSWYSAPEPRWPHRAGEPSTDAVLAEEMGLPETMYPDDSKKMETKRDAPNQFLMLIYNLLLADIQQSIAFALNVSWVRRNAVVTESTTCWAQGWFVSTGDLASSAFITTIAVHTYLSVVRDYRLPTWAFWTMVGSVWFFVYALAAAGVIATNNGAAEGGLYVRASAWCWINVRYEAMRLYLHYLWMFASFFVTAALYILVFNHIRRTDPSLRLPSSPNDAASSAGKGGRDLKSGQTDAHSRPGSSNGSHEVAPRSSPSHAGHHPAFLIYPVIYILCTAPLALGRVISMTGKQVPLDYFCFAGAMIASNGWLDVLLFSTTRHVIMFRASPGFEETGLNTFAFMRTPANRQFGNMIWVQGAGSPTLNRPSVEGTGGWLQKLFRKSHRGRDTKGERHHRHTHRSISQESLRRRGGNMEGIQMETVTTVVVEVKDQPGGKMNNGRPHSIDTIDRERAESFGSMSGSMSFQ